MDINPRIKICCIKSIEEAELAIQYGADAIGLVGSMPSGPGIISDKLIKKIAQKVPPPISTFLLTSETSARKIIEHHRRVNTNCIQIVDQLQEGDYRAIKNALPPVKIVQVIHVINEHSIDQALRLDHSVDALLLDSGNPNREIKELGGTGRVHNWKISKQIVEKSDNPVFLAGGLNPDNIKSAIDQVKPFGIDVCSGIRTNGKLDSNKLEKFISEINL